MNVQLHVCDVMTSILCTVNARLVMCELVTLGTDMQCCARNAKQDMFGTQRLTFAHLAVQRWNVFLVPRTCQAVILAHSVSDCIGTKACAMHA